MPRNPSLDQRIRWHLAHLEHCACRPIPAKLLAELEKRGVAAPKPGKRGA